MLGRDTDQRNFHLSASLKEMSPHGAFTLPDTDTDTETDKLTSQLESVSMPISVQYEHHHATIIYSTTFFDWIFS